MKKTILLSVAATGIIFAGGDIAPAQPVTPAAAPAACDFWGSIGYRYDFLDDGTNNLGDSVNNKSKAVMVLGVEKALGYGFGFGAELDGIMKFDGSLNKQSESAVLSQAYLTYKAGNTAIKAGRQALPKSVSPWAWTHRSVNAIEKSFNGITIVNTDLKDTTLAAAWVASVASGGTDTKINGSDKGLYMLGAIYKGIANTTLSSSIYYIPSNGNKGKAVSAWAAAESKISSAKVGLQLAYAKADANSVALLSNANGTKATFGAAAYVGGKFDALDAKLTLAYINNGDATLTLGSESAFWGDSLDHSFGKNAVPGTKQKIAKLMLGYKLGKGKLYTEIAADKPDSGLKTAIGARVGYKFKLYGVNAKVEYRYVKNKDFTDRKDQRIRIEGVYKF